MNWPLLEWRDDGNWRLIQDYILNGYTVPAGFICDGASVPRLLWAYADEEGEVFPAALVHDHMYTVQPCSRKEADDIFWANMIYSGVRDSKARVIWAAVRAFGWIPWRRRAKWLP